MDDEDKIPLDRNERLKLFWYAPEFEQARRFAGDPEEYSYEDITDEDLDEARVPKYQGEPLPLPVMEQSGLEYLLSTLGMSSNPEVTNYLQVAGPIEPIDPLLEAYKQVYEGVRDNYRNPSYLDLTNACLTAMEALDVYNRADNDVDVTLTLPSSSEVALALMMRLHLRGFKPEIISKFNVPDELKEGAQYSLLLGVKVNPGNTSKALYWGGALKDTTLIRDNFNDGRGDLDSHIKFWTLLDRFNNRMADIQAAVELVGDLSEGLDYISYNEEGIRAAWVEGRLNSEVQWDKENDPPKYQRFIDLLGTEVREDDDYDALLTERIATIGGWPKKYTTDPNELDELTIQEQLKVLPIQLTMPGSRQEALNRHCNLQAELEKRLPSNATGTD